MSTSLPDLFARSPMGSSALERAVAPWSEAHSSSHLRSRDGLSEGSAAVFITYGTTDERQWVEPYGYRSFPSPQLRP
jgi:hypothetical protein